MQLIQEADKTDFVKQLRDVLVKIHNIEVLIRFVITKEISKAINVLPLLKPAESIRGYCDGAMASHVHLSHRMNGLISNSSSLPLCAQTPPAEEPRQSAQQPSAAGCCRRVDTRLNMHVALRTTPLTDRRAKALCLCEGNPMLPRGTAHLEYLNVPEVTKRGFVQHSTWLLA